MTHPPSPGTPGSYPPPQPAGGTNPYAPPPAGSPVPPPPSPYGAVPSDPYGGSPSDPYRAPDALGPTSPAEPKRGIKGWQAGALATGTGVVGLVVGLVLGGLGGDDPAPTADHPSPDRPAATAAPAGGDPTPAGDPDPTDGPETADPEPEDPDAPAAGEEGSRSNPYPIGTVVANSEWEVSLGEPREGWAEIRERNSFNDPPADGMEYHLVPLSVTYVGADSAVPWLELTVEFVGDDARTYTGRCGVIPDDLMDVDALYEGGSAEGNVCVEVPEGAPGLWTLRAGWDGNTVFFTAD